MGRWIFFCILDHNKNIRMSHPREEKIQITRHFHLLLPTGQTNKQTNANSRRTYYAHNRRTNSPSRKNGTWWWPFPVLELNSQSPVLLFCLARQLLLVPSQDFFLFLFPASFYFILLFSLCSRFRWKWGQDRRKRSNFYFFIWKAK